MKKFLVAIFTLVIFSSLTGCVTLVDVEREKPSTFKTRKVNSIYVGRFNIPGRLWKTFGYKSKARWLKEVRGNNAGIKTYLREYMPDKKIRGARKKPSRGDIYITFKYFNYVQTFPHGCDEMKVGVEFINIRTGRSIYKAVLVIIGTAPFPRNWKGQTIEGRLDNMMYNLAGFIAKKLQ